jgi:hypothetical protein
MGLRWQTGEDWHGWTAKASIGGLTVKVQQSVDMRPKWCIMDDETCLVRGETDDWSVAIRRAQTAAALILKSRTKACPVSYTLHQAEPLIIAGIG